MNLAKTGFSTLPNFWQASIAKLVSFGLLLLLTDAAVATVVECGPHWPVVVQGGAGVVTWDAWNSLALYRTSDGTMVHRFPAGERAVQSFDVSSAGAFLLVGHDDGSIALWDLHSGKRKWERSSKRTGLDVAWGVSFSYDGSHFTAHGMGSCVPVFTTESGERTGGVDFEEGGITYSAVLSPDGSSGYYSLNAYTPEDPFASKVFSFDVASGKPVNLGISGYDLQVSSDGKYLAVRTRESAIRIVTTKDNSIRHTIPVRASHIRASRDGTFRVLGGGTATRVNPESGERESVGDNANIEFMLSDFDPESAIGVAESPSLVTRILDLRREAILHEIDNSSGYRPVLVSSTEIATRMPENKREPMRTNSLRSGAAVMVAVALLGVHILLLAKMVRRRRR